MRSLILVSTFLLGLVAAAPSASAQSECVTRIDALCDWLDENTATGELFGAYADVGVAAIGLIVAVLLLVLVVWIFRKPGEKVRFSAEPREGEHVVAQGQSTQLLIDVENKRPGGSTDFLVEWDTLPPGWTAESFASVAYPSGFTTPLALSPGQPLSLASSEAGGHQATVAVQLTAPPEGAGDEVIEVPVRVVPLLGGIPRRRRLRPLSFTVTLSSRRSPVEITDVTHEPPQITAGQAVRTRALLANTSAEEARDVGVSFLLNDRTVDRKVVASLAANQETAVEFEWIPSSGQNRIRISLA